MRVKGGIVTRKRHKKVLELAKGFRGSRHRLFRTAKEAVLHAGQYAFAGRKLRKRDMRSLWITRLSGVLEAQGIAYSRFINNLKVKNITLNRKVLSEIANSDPKTFEQIVAATRAQ